MNLFVAGVPRAKQSFRATYQRKRGGYTPQAVKDWQTAIRATAQAEMITNDLKPYEGRIVVMLEFYLPKDLADIDNLTKAVLDALEGVVYKNDRKVHKLSVVKLIDPKGKHGVGIEVIPYWV